MNEMAVDGSHVLLSDIKATLETIRTILEIQARPALKEEINALASTSERRKMWILSNGEAKTADLAVKAGLKLRAAKYFVAEGRRSGLLVFPKRGCPKRAVNIIPESWEEVAVMEEQAADDNESGEDLDAGDEEDGASNGES